LKFVLQRAIPILFAATLVAPTAAQALLIRADRDDAEYVELASRYAAAVALPGGGEAVLIAPSWLLTTAQLAKALPDKARVTIAGKGYDVILTRTHPGWSDSKVNDIALVQLKRGVPEEIEPLLLYRFDNEAGKAVVVVAHGETGKIGADTRVSDRRARAAINTVDRLGAREFGMRVKPGDEASDLQGALTRGELGAPAIIETTQGLFLVGLATSIEGEWETFVRVSAYVPWIEATMLEVAKREVEQMLDPERR
jgi:hypothetical protein